jgi:hypothetical protein
MSQLKAKTRTYKYRMLNDTNDGRTEEPCTKTAKGNTGAGGSHSNTKIELDDIPVDINTSFKHR